MVRLAKQARRNPAIRTFTAHLVRNIPEKDYTSEVNKVFSFVQNEIRYLLDINEVETIQTPEHTLEVQYGDCDDKATLLVSMLESIGHPSRFAAVALQEPNQYDHVLVQTLIGENWVSLDPTEDYGMGWEPPGIKTYLIRCL